LKGSMKKYISLAKALAVIMTLCVILSCANSPVRAAFEYTPIVAEIPFRCVKAAGIDSSYEFVIERLDASSPAPQEDVVKVDGSGNAKFGVVIDEPGTYRYKVFEKAGDNKNIIYDDTVYMVTLFVTNNNEGGLEYQVILAKDGMVKPTEVAFINDAIRRKDPIVKTGDMGKTVQGRAWILLATGATLLLLASIKRKEPDYEE